ncbi:MAG: hypothetical protein WCF94_00210 [bacterium]
MSTINKQTAAFISAMCTCLPAGLTGEKMQKWMGNPTRLQEVLEALILDEVDKDFPIWKTIKIGTGPKNAGDFRKVLKKAGSNISDWANDILGKSAFEASVSTTENEVDLVNLSVRELGFKEGASIKEIYEQAIKLGLDLCPAEVGPQLRLQYQDQPRGEWIIIAMEPITDSDGDLEVFHVECGDDGGLWLSSYYGHAGRFYNADHRFVFLRRK